jgi:hypothetical protein
MFLAGFVAASTSNVLSGSIFEFLKRPSRVSIAVVGDVALNAGNLFSFQIADVLVAQNAQIFCNGLLTTSGVQNLGPKFPDDFFVQNEPGLSGDRLVLSITRATGNISWACQIIEVA